ncbi:hypothetical protein BWI95_17130 [Kosakonia cowanii JCM 10956 = DSM 18146]|uniref:Uncharacterized protein n=1 Tax=Kosakonia cowanii JCM 10956 = DSM 18146 TaxID=1300165 RepID=A0A807LKA7_9ENTR|nr:hypothetical protein [Kosakonia cowanii]APZ06643.1 hypothetical protein BWI95_17130 [Kosakonia cowanii JCM 10956 = DSM 18146]
MTGQFNRDELEVLAFNGETHTERALARMLLAGIDREPVAKVDNIGVCWYADDGVSRKPAVGEKLYAAPPAPVAVPDVGEFRIFTQAGGVKVAVKDGKTKNHLFGMGWNACRAAMLKTGPVTAATVPDGWTANADANDALVMLDRIDTVDCDDDERIESVKNIIRRLAAAPVFGSFRENENSSTNNFRENSETSTKSHEKCWCRTCRPVGITDMRFVVCPDCGNKRCPHANDHRNACSGSNEPGQVGSAYPAAPEQEG